MIEPVSFQIEFGKFNTDVKKISFPPGIHVIYGESGTGKSSFIKKLAGTEIDTKENFKISKLSFPEKFQIVFQDPDNQIVSRTVQGELAFALECHGTDPDKIGDWIHVNKQSLPPAVSLDQNTASLSGGEKEILNLITAFQLGPPLVMVDDGLSFLSIKNKEKMISLIRTRISEFQTVVVWLSSERNDLTIADSAWELSLNNFMNIDAPRGSRYHPIRIKKGNMDIAIKNLKFAFEDKDPVYDGLNIELTSCRALGLAGDNGCGKTTLASLLFDYLQPLHGTIDIKIQNRSIDIIGYMDQFPENMLGLNTPAQFLSQLIDSRLFNIRKTSTFLNRLIRFQISWNAIADLPGDKLSWPTLRIFLIVLLAHCEYDILILDEPTFGLGWGQRKRLRKFLGEYLTQNHLIVVSHDRDFLFSMCDQIIDIDSSKVIQNSLVKFE